MTHNRIKVESIVPAKSLGDLDFLTLTSFFTSTDIVDGDEGSEVGCVDDGGAETQK